MNDDTKLFLALLFVMSVGLALVAYGLGWTSRPAATFCGILIYFAAMSGLKAIWTGRS